MPLGRPRGPAIGTFTRRHRKMMFMRGSPSWQGRVNSESLTQVRWVWFLSFIRNSNTFILPRVSVKFFVLLSGQRTTVNRLAEIR